MMLRFALRTARARFRSHLVTAAVALVGTALLTAFAALFETGWYADAANAEALTTLSAILGGWTVVIVAFGVVSTVTLTVQQREHETALLRCIGATSRQIRLLVVAETLAAAVPAIALGLLPGAVIGALVLDRMVAFGMALDGVALRTSALSAGVGIAVSLLASWAGAGFAARKASAVAPVRALTASVAAPDRAGRLLSAPQRVGGLVSLAVGLALAVTTLFMANGPLLSATAGPAAVAVAIGLAVFSPGVGAVIGRVAASAPGPVARLACRNIGARAARSAAVTGPLVLLVGVTTATLYMQSTEESTYGTPGGTDLGTQIAASGNYLVVAMIIAFSAMVVINTLIAATRHRRREFGLLRVAGATRAQVFAVVGAEAALTTVGAVALGSVAALAALVPYSLVRTGSPVASGSVWVFAAIVAGTFAIALLATLPTTARTLGTRSLKDVVAA